MLTGSGRQLPLMHEARSWKLRRRVKKKSGELNDNNHINTQKNTPDSHKYLLS